MPLTLVQSIISYMVLRALLGMALSSEPVTLSIAGYWTLHKKKKGRKDGPLGSHEHPQIP